MRHLRQTITLFFLLFFVFHTLQAPLLEQRSVTSRYIETVFRLRRPFIRPLTDQNIARYFAQREAINNEPVTPPRTLRHRVEIQSFETLDAFYFPVENEASFVVIYVHGGSYVNPPSALHFNYLNTLSNHLEAPIYLPLYPRAPNHTVEEALPALSAFFETVGARHAEQSIVLMGDSAGASLALALTLEHAKQGKILPSQLIMISPWLNLALDHPEVNEKRRLDPVLNPDAALYLGDAWRGTLPRSHPWVSPMRGDISVLTMPMLLLMGSYDVLLPDARVFYEEANTLGLTLELSITDRMLHVYPLFPFMREARVTLENIIGFIKEGT